MRPLLDYFIPGVLFGMLLFFIMMTLLLVTEVDNLVMVDFGPAPADRSLPAAAQWNAIQERTNYSINGVYFPSATYCIHLNRDNVDALYKTMDHELLHHLVQYEDCGDETCKKHFCE